MSSVLLGLGPFRFSVTDLNFTDLSRTFEYRWEPQARIGRRPAHQFLGPGVEQINLQGAIYPHYCLAQEERILTSDMRWVPCGDLRDGDEILGLDEYAPAGRRDRRWRWGQVLLSEPARKECVRVHLDNDDSVVCTVDHPWLAGYPTCGKPIRKRRWIEARHLIPGPRTNRRHNVGLAVIKALKPWNRAESYDAGWLGGLYDGEGSLSGRGGVTLGLAQKPGVVLDKAKHVLREHGFAFVEYPRPGGATVVELCGVAEVMRALGTFAPVRLLQALRATDISGFASTKSFGAEGCTPKVVELEPLGMRDIQSITTSTATYVGEGYLMHNTGGFGQLERMRADAQRGVPYRLASGYGINHGTFCIRSISDEQTIFHKSGAPLKVMFQIGLVAYGEDNQAAGLSFGALALPVVGSLISPVLSPSPIAPLSSAIGAAGRGLPRLLPETGD